MNRFDEETGSPGVFQHSSHIAVCVCVVVGGSWNQRMKVIGPFQSDGCLLLSTSCFTQEVKPHSTSWRYLQTEELSTDGVLCYSDSPDRPLVHFHAPGIYNTTTLLLSNNDSTLYVGAQNAVLSLDVSRSDIITLKKKVSLFGD